MLCKSELKWKVNKSSSMLIDHVYFIIDFIGYSVNNIIVRNIDIWYRSRHGKQYWTLSNIH